MAENMGFDMANEKHQAALLKLQEIHQPKVLHIVLNKQRVTACDGRSMKVGRCGGLR